MPSLPALNRQDDVLEVHVLYTAAQPTSRVSVASPAHVRPAATTPTQRFHAPPPNSLTALSPTLQPPHHRPPPHYPPSTRPQQPTHPCHGVAPKKRTTACHTAEQHSTAQLRQRLRSSSPATLRRSAPSAPVLYSRALRDSASRSAPQRSSMSGYDVPDQPSLTNTSESPPQPQPQPQADGRSNRPSRQRRHSVDRREIGQFFGPQLYR